MLTSSRGVTLIKQFEGLRLDAYRDAVGIWTIGYGHTAEAGVPEPCAGMRITRQEADALLARDLGKYETAVDEAISRPVAQNQFDAMVSLCFNIGEGNFAKSRVVGCFNSGLDYEAAQAFLAWTKAGGASLPGLRRRRQAERRLFLSQTAPAKWGTASAGGAAAGTGLAYGFGQAAVASLGDRFADVATWQLLAVAGIATAALAVVVLAFIGHDRRERLWSKIFGGWLA